MGWCWETGYVSIKKRHFENRGFLRGPWLPIYGTGAIMMLIISAPFRSNLVVTYFVGVVGATALELVTGIAMEAMFKVRYWDYSNKFCNYKGYICLGSSVAWGFFTVILTRYIHEPIEHLVLKAPKSVVDVGAVILTVCMLVDFTLSFHGAIKLRLLLSKVREGALAEIAVLEDRINAMIGLASGKWKKYILRRHLYRIKANSDMVSKQYAGEIGDLKEFLAAPKALKGLESLQTTVRTDKSK